MWKEHKKSWEETVGTSFYVDLSYFARLIEYSIMNGDEKLALRILDRIEDFLKDSSEESENVIWLFLEDLTNSLEHEEEKYMKVFVSLLGPLSKKLCKELDKFWGSKTPGL